MPSIKTGKREPGRRRPTSTTWRTGCASAWRPAGFRTSRPTDEALGGLAVRVGQDEEGFPPPASPPRRSPWSTPTTWRQRRSPGSRAVRDAMNTALTTVLTGFDYRIRPNTDGLGHRVLPLPVAPAARRSR